MRRTFFISFATWIIFYVATTFKCQGQITGYNLTKPDLTLILPDTLREISGLTYIDSSSIACIQDENGIIFIYDVLTNKIKKQFSFGANGDYEEITRVAQTLYVLRSDGMLFEISNYLSKDLKITSFNTGIPANNNEGLCYDSDKNILLIACKGKIEKGPEYKDKRFIYGFNLKDKKLIKEPIFEFNLQNIKQFARDAKINIETITKKKDKTTEPIIRFRTSAICIHPITKKLYLLSDSDHLLFIFSANGKIEHIEKLDPILFNKAEGITFFENADMLITNEAQSKKPTLLRFNYKPK